MTPIPLCLVTNPSAFVGRPDAQWRQKQAEERLRHYRTAWCVVRKAVTENDFKLMCEETQGLHRMHRDSHEILGTNLHLPYVRELMRLADQPISLRENEVSGKAHWRGILNNDTVIGPQFFSNFQTVDDDINCIFVRVHDVFELPPLGETPPPEQSRARMNYNSLEGIFLRGVAVDRFRETYPDMVFGWAWDEACVVWATNEPLVNIHAIDHLRAAIHVMHSSPARAGGLGKADDIADYNGRILRDYFYSL